MFTCVFLVVFRVFQPLSGEGRYRSPWSQQLFTPERNRAALPSDQGGRLCTGNEIYMPTGSALTDDRFVYMLVICFMFMHSNSIWAGGPGLTSTQDVWWCKKEEMMTMRRMSATTTLLTKKGYKWCWRSLIRAIEILHLWVFKFINSKKVIGVILKLRRFKYV